MLPKLALTLQFMVGCLVNLVKQILCSKAGKEAWIGFTSISCWFFPYLLVSRGNLGTASLVCWLLGAPKHRVKQDAVRARVSHVHHFCVTVLWALLRSLTSQTIHSCTKKEVIYSPFYLCGLLALCLNDIFPSGGRTWLLSAAKYNGQLVAHSSAGSCSATTSSDKISVSRCTLHTQFLFRKSSSTFKVLFSFTQRRTTFSYL